MRKLLGRLGVVLLVAAAPVGVYLSPSDGPSYPDTWDPRLVDLVSFVETERGLTFEHPVEVEFLDDAAFKDKVRSPEPTAEEREELDRAVEELRALRLVSGHPDLFKAGNDLVTDRVVGLYVPEDEALYVRGTSLTPYVRSTVVHELTHAAQDQHFDLEELQGDAEDESIVRTLIEGDAVRVEEAYQRRLSQADQESYAATAAGFAREADSGDDIPQVLQDVFSYPYVFGPTLLDTLEAKGGNGAVDAAFRHPPVTDAQVVDPSTYPLSFSPRDLPAPTLPEGAKADGDSHPFGQVGVLEVLGSKLGYTESWAAVQGWAGDEARSYRVKGLACVALDIAAADDTAATRLEAAFARWHQGLASTSISRTGTVVAVRACDPGGSTALTPPSPRAFDVLAQRTQVIHAIMRASGRGFIGARCVTDRVITAFGPAGFFALNSRQPSPAVQQRLQVVLQRAYQVC